MKSLFSKLSVLLLAAGFAVVGCQDFAEDIRQVEEKVENIGGNVGDLNVSTDGLKAEIAALEAQHAADIKAAEEAIAKLKAYGAKQGGNHRPRQPPHRRDRQSQDYGKFQCHP